MPRTLVIAQAPELQAYLRYLVGRNGWVCGESPSLESAMESVAADRPDLLIMDGDFPPEAMRAFRDGCHRRLPTGRFLFLTGAPDRIQPMMRWGDQMLPKPFAVGQFKECLGRASSRTGRLACLSRAGLARWARRKLDYYSPAQAMLMGAILLLLVYNVVRTARSGLTEETGLQAIFWGAILLLCSLFGHVRDKHMRWEGLLFAKFALLVSLLPPLHTLPDRLKQGFDTLAS